MTQLTGKISLRVMCALAICAVFAIFVLSGGRVWADDAKPWIAPADAKIVKNPVPPTPTNVAAGAEVFKTTCALCHGEQGKGDGPAAAALTVEPTNFTDAKLMRAETDGSLFWKISEGRGAMQPMKNKLSETQRWQVVDYIREFTKGAKK